MKRKFKLLQLVSFISLSLLIYYKIDSFIWQLVNLFLIVILIPGLTYFIINSLRQASTKMISEDEEITIKITNVVKIYDQASRFVREWNRGKNKIETNKTKLSLTVYLASTFINIYNLFCLLLFR